MNIIHTEGKDGKTYANIAGVMRLPKGMQGVKLDTEPIIFDLDEDPLDQLELLPEWIRNKVKESETYMDRASGQIKTEVAGAQSPVLEEVKDDLGDELPF